MPTTRSPIDPRTRRPLPAARPEPHDLAGRRTWVWRYPAVGERRGSVLLVHGFRGDHHGLADIAALCAADGVEALVPDLPGFGRSAQFPGPHDLDAYVAWLRALWADLPPDPTTGSPRGLLGHSFGSVVAAHAVAAGLAPDRLVLLNPIALAARASRDLAGRPHRPDLGTLVSVGYYRLATALPEPAGLAVLRAWPVVRAMSEVMATTHDPALRRAIHAEHRDHFSDFASRRAVVEAFDAASRHDVAEVARRVAVPTLLVAGARDVIARPADERLLVHEFRDARLDFVEGVGHLVHYEAPARAARLTTTFVTTGH